VKAGRPEDRKTGRPEDRKTGRPEDRKTRNPKTISSSKMKKINQQLDFDAEARALWGRLNLDPTSRTHGHWNALDSIFRHPTGGLLRFSFFFHCSSL
jgi:hypothetical protein